MTSLLCEFLERNAEFEMIYSNDANSNPAAFRSACSACGPNVVLATLSNGRVIGGYSAQSWNGTNSHKPDPSSFIFLLDQPERKVVQKAANINTSVYDHTSYYPAFGDGPELSFNADHKVYVNLNGDTFNPTPEGPSFLLAGNSSLPFTRLEVLKVKPLTGIYIWPGCDQADKFLHDPAAIKAEILAART